MRDRTNRPARPARRGFLGALLALALVKGLFLVAFIPPFQTPDEYGHYDYALYLSHIDWSDFLLGRIAPVERLSFGAISTLELRDVIALTDTTAHIEGVRHHRVRRSIREMLAGGDGYRDRDEASRLREERVSSTLRNYPPLYYLGAAALHRASRGAGLNPVARFYVLRLASVACFLVTLWVAARFIREIGLSEGVQRIGLVVLALHPQLAMVTIAVQPDNAALLLVTAMALWFTRLVRGSHPSALAWCSVLLGLLFLVKLQFALPWLAGTATFLCWRARGATGVRRVLRELAVLAAIVAAVAGWWYVRGWWLYGNALGIVAVQRAPTAGSWSTNLADLWRDWRSLTFTSYWGTWGWLDIPYPAAFTRWLVVASALPGCVYLAAMAARVRHSGAPLPVMLADTLRAPATWLAVVYAMFAVELLVVGVTLGGVASQGRHWLAFAALQMAYLVGFIDMAGGAPGALGPSARGRLAALVATGALAAVSTAAVLVDAVPSGWVLVTMRAGTDARAEVFYDSGEGFVPQERDGASVRAMAGLTTLRIPVRSSRVNGLRLDVLDTAGRVSVADVRILDRHGRTRWHPPLAAVRAANEIHRLRYTAGALEVETSPTATDPQLSVHPPGPVVLQAGPIADALDLARHGIRRASRRWGSVGWMLWAQPLWFALWLTAWLGPFGRAAPARHALTGRRLVLGALLVALILAVGVALVLESHAFYYG